MSDRAWRPLLLGALLFLAALVPTAAARAAAPSVTVSPNAVTIGQTVQVEVAGFPERRAVIVTLCGNEGRRGSVDCDLAGSVAFPISRFDQRHVTPFPIDTPPIHCPCVIKVTNTPGLDVAYAPIAIEGFPVGPVEGNKLYQPLELTVTVTRRAQNPFTWLRSFLGGATPYNLNVRLHNRLDDEVDGIKITARAGRSASDQARRVVIDGPKRLGAGETWNHSERVTLSAPVIGEFFWSVTASGDGALTRSSVTTNHQPYGLYALAVALLGDLGWIGWRRVRKRRAKPADEPEASVAPTPKVNVPAPSVGAPSDAESILARRVPPEHRS